MDSRKHDSISFYSISEQLINKFTQFCRVATMTSYSLQRIYLVNHIDVLRMCDIILYTSVVQVTNQLQQHDIESVPQDV